MSTFLLDTNVPSELTRPSPDERISTWVKTHPDLHLSVISIGEIRKGLHLLPQSRRRVELEEWLDSFLMPLVASRILPVTQPIAERWGALTAERRLQGLPLNAADGLIAATALEHGLTLVTRNVKDFFGLGLSIVNPWGGNVFEQVLYEKLHNEPDGKPDKPRDPEPGGGRDL